MSHSAKYKQYVSDVASSLLKFEVHAFVAHETMEVTRDSQEQIEHALRSMEAFVAFIHPEFTPSAWCQQELGWALGRESAPLRHPDGHRPYGLHRTHTVAQLD